ncbi:MAG: phage holin family protein [Thermoanaerobaculia bacterium]|nr:phage holin family protein [Thermoanaerobaculia bacterium]
MAAASNERAGWLDLFRDFGSSLLTLGRAELSAFQRDLSESSRRLLGALGLFLAAIVFAFWTVGVATAFLVVLLARWLPPWGAALAVTGLLALLATILALAGRARLRQVESPLATARRRMDDHLAWWQSQSPPDDGPEDEDEDFAPLPRRRRRDPDEDENWRIGP